MSTKENHEISKERKRILSIYTEIEELLPGFLDGKITIDEPCDLQRIGLLTDEIRSESYLHYSSEVNLNNLMTIANDIVNRISLANYNAQESFFIVDSILDSIWHQRKEDELSDRNKRNLAALVVNILNKDNDQYWVDSLSPSASNYNHCIYFIFMLENRFRKKNEEFKSVFNHLKKYIDRYGHEHHLSIRWLNRFQSTYS